MKIAIVHEFLTKIGGAEKVLLSLCKMFPDAPVYTLLYDETGTKEIFKRYHIIESQSLKKYPRFLRMKSKLFLGKLSQAIEEFDFSEYDVVISSSNSFAHGIITKPKTFHLCYCHSPMRYAWDWHYEYLKEHHIGFGFKGLFIRSLLHKIRIWDKVASKRVDFWIANSKNVQDRIKKYYRTESKIIYPPVNIDRINLSESSTDDYYVCVSRLEPYKKIDLAIEAFNKLGKQFVIIGSGSDRNRLEGLSKKNIEFLGWQSDKSIYEYIRNSRGFVFPGEDDFGITPVEAMACGKPVVAYGAGGAKETIIDKKTGVLFHKPEAESLIEAILYLEENSDRFTPESCRSQAEKFSEENFQNDFRKTLDEEYEKYIKR